MAEPLLEPLMLEGDVRLAVYRWGQPSAQRPALLLTHGTGFGAAVWCSVAEQLAEDFTVYALDRRGHGASDKPEDAYHFADFADDAARVIDALRLERAYALGHSAGATDLLLASVQRPDAFAAIFAMEPTAMNARAPHVSEEMQKVRGELLDAASRRRAGFASFEAAFEHYTTRGVFQTWRPELLRAYVRYGFEPCPDGSVTLRCTPQHERAMLAQIYRVMDGSYEGDARGNPFELLERIRVPVRIATTEASQPIFKLMAQTARDAIPHASTHHFEGAGHTIAQVQPARVVAEARRFWSEL